MRISFSIFHIRYKCHFPRIVFHQPPETGALRAIVSYQAMRCLCLDRLQHAFSLASLHFGSSATWLDFSYGKFMREGKIHICCAHTNTRVLCFKRDGENMMIFSISTRWHFLLLCVRINVLLFTLSVCFV